MIVDSDPSTGYRPQVAGLEWMRSRANNVAAFLTERRLDPAWLTDVVTTAVGPGQLLLTSSPVQGLSNPTSDLDFIRITDQPVDGPRISTKIFERGHHLEVVSFTVNELTRALCELARIASRSPAEVVAGSREWDQRLEPRRKQTERIVNGVTLAGEMPYIDALANLAVVWSRASLHTAMQHVVYLGLAEAAGELRGRVGYAANAVLHLADALLSLHGDVYTTRKWYLLRWTRAALHERGHDDLRPIAVDVDRLRAGVSAALHDRAPLANAYARVAADLAAVATGVAGAGAAVRLRDDVDVRAFLPGARVLVGRTSSVVVADGELPDGGVRPLTSFLAVPVADARLALAAIRAGLAEVDVHYGCRSGPA